VSNIGKRLDDILAGFNTQMTTDSNPADEEFQRPSSFPERVDITKVHSDIKDTIGSDLGDDFEHARNVLRHLLDRGVLTLEGAINIAKDTENARAVEVVSLLMSTISDVTTKLMKLHDASQVKNLNKPNENLEGASPGIYVLGKGKDAKQILNHMLGKALNGEVIEGEIVKDEKRT